MMNGLIRMVKMGMGIIIIIIIIIIKVIKLDSSMRWNRQKLVEGEVINQLTNELIIIIIVILIIIIINYFFYFFYFFIIIINATTKVVCYSCLGVT